MNSSFNHVRIFERHSKYRESWIWTCCRLDFITPSFMPVNVYFKAPKTQRLFLSVFRLLSKKPCDVYKLFRFLRVVAMYVSGWLATHVHHDGRQPVLWLVRAMVVLLIWLLRAVAMRVSGWLATHVHNNGRQPVLWLIRAMAVQPPQAEEQDQVWQEVRIWL